MVPSPLPTHVYKILPEAPPDPIPEQFPLSDLDRNDGFVHLSTASQIPITASLWFTSSTRLWLVKLPFSFADKTTWENGEGCPHLHGNFGGADVEGSKEFVRDEGQDWEAVFKKDDGWLV